MNRRALSCCCGLLFVLVLFGCASVESLPHAKARVVDYYRNGGYDKEVCAVMKRARRDLEKAAGDKLAVVLDVDDTAISTYEYQAGMGFGHNGKLWHQWIALKRGTAVQPVLEYCRAAHAKGVAIFFVSGRREAQRAATEECLAAQGYPTWAHLYSKADDYKEKSVVPYKVQCRRDIVSKGYRIIANIGDQQSDLEGGYAEKTYLLPNKIYFVK